MKILKFIYKLDTGHGDTETVPHINVSQLGARKKISGDTRKNVL